MKTIVPHLHVTEPRPLGFGDPPLLVRTAILERPGGNVAVYGADPLEHELEAVRELGGISAQYLNHAHEATAAAGRVREALDAPLHVHAADADETAQQVSVDATFDAPHTIGDDIEVIPIPGHSPGATAYLFDTGEHRVLLTGDSVYLRDGVWSAAFLDAFSDRSTYVASLELLAELDFDVLLPGVAHADREPAAFTDRADARERLLAIAQRLRDGGDR